MVTEINLLPHIFFSLFRFFPTWRKKLRINLALLVEFESSIYKILRNLIHENLGYMDD
ncbi:MAG: hypothetical protein ACTSU4_12110 [Promethearchaeota archaeon]